MRRTFGVAGARRDTQVVLGTVLPDPGLPAALKAAWRCRHRSSHVHGATFGIRADACRALGGWHSLTLGEVVDLTRRAASAGHQRITRTASDDTPWSPAAAPRPGHLAASLATWPPWEGLS